MDQLFYNGVIHTLDARSTQADAIAITNDRIVAVGSESECRARLSQSAVAVNLRGRAVLPGFIDTHMHPVLAAYFELEADLQGISHFGELRAALLAQEARVAPGRWVVGLRYGENLQVDATKLDRLRLDSITNCPTVVVQADGHKLFANTAAIRAAGLNEQTPDPAGGLIDREPSGFPSGAFYETASQLILGAMPFPEVSDLVTAARRTFDRFASYGVTNLGAILQAGPEGPAGPSGEMEAAMFSILNEYIPQRCYVFGITNSLEPMTALESSGLFANDPWAHRRIAGIKIFADGTLGSRTACLCTGYADAPDVQGFMVLDDKTLYAAMERAHLQGYQIAVHAIGDEANRRCLLLYRRLLAAHPRKHRHRIEHASLLDPGLIREIADLGVVVSAQPAFIRSEKGFLDRRLGSRTDMVYPLKSLLEAGVVVAGSSDAPVDRFSVLNAVTLATCRDGFQPEQCISPEQAFRLYTSSAAYAQFEENVSGTLEAGKRADLVVLEHDPFASAPEAIEDIAVSATLCGGRVIYGEA